MVFAVLIGYFGYQWWFNPARAVKRQLGELAAKLSVPANEADLARVTRVVQLRRYFAPDVRVRFGTGGPEITSRDALLAAVSTMRPPGGEWEVQFVDVQIKMRLERGKPRLHDRRTEGPGRAHRRTYRRCARSERRSGEAERRLGDYDRGVAGDPGDDAASLIAVMIQRPVMSLSAFMTARCIVTTSVLLSDGLTVRQLHRRRRSSRPSTPVRRRIS